MNLIGIEINNVSNSENVNINRLNKIGFLSLVLRFLKSKEYFEIAYTNFTSIYS